MTNKEIENLLEDYSEDEALFIKLKIWFDSRIEQLQQVANLKDDEKLQIDIKEGDPVTVEGDLRRGLQHGFRLAIDVFGKFPINISINDEEEDS